MREYLTVIESAGGEYTEKRSRFVSGIYHCETEEAAAEILSSVRSANFGANHNVYAYVLKNGTARFSDDSEPHGTAGKPVLEVIEGAGLKDVMVVVTRYFGGVLLGTGGLVRSYSTAAKSALGNAAVVKMCECAVMSLVCDYSDYQKLGTVFKNADATVDDTVFEDKVTVKFTLLEAKREAFINDLTEAFSSRITAVLDKNEILPVKI